MRYSALFISFFISLMSFSQNIQGIVTDQNNEPIAMAVIQLYENENIISYTTTNDDGTFHLENTRIGRYTLVANHWSFEKKTQDITLDNQDIKITITLEAKAFELEQVEVQSRAALAHKKGDTLTYNLNAIADGNERKIRELLNKLPGVKVDPITGKITANGKVIDDLLINGQKLFGNNHKLAVENIRAEILDEISLINNYETFSALKDIEGSDKTAMNLKIKDDYLGEITGEIELLGGYENRYKAHPKLFQFNKKYSLSVVANANNTAEESMTMYDFIELNSGIKSDIRNQNLSKTTSNTSFPSFLLADKNVSKKSNEFLSIYSVMQPNENWSINSYLIGNHAKINENILSRKNFYANNFLIEDTQESKTHNYNLQAKINSDYYFDRNALLNYTFSFSKNETNKTNHTINNLNNNSLYYMKHKILIT
ncbi:MAG: carboxypeptidase-like regulatory domain-containing protein [Capnocytophaga sp.]|nr:carboxypeptidase-like regulatory domain-containing protein [Capnocytophaga sp.]